jgi:hypothetical protein
VDAYPSWRTRENRKLWRLLIAFAATALLLWVGGLCGIISPALVPVWIPRVWAVIFVWNLLYESFDIQSRRMAKIEDRLDCLERKANQ